MLAKGSHQSGFRVNRSVTLEGACPSEVVVGGTIEFHAPLWLDFLVHAQVGADVTMRGFTVTGPGVGVLVTDGATVEMERVNIDETSAFGVLVVGAGSEVSATGVRVAHTAVSADGGGMGMAAYQGARLTLQGVASVANGTGVVAGGAGTEVFAIFEGKKKARTLPEGVDPRYLRGIVKNLAEEAEGWQTAEALLQERLAARDLALKHLGQQRDALEQSRHTSTELVIAFVDKALASARGIDRTLWLLAAADAITGEPPQSHRHLLRLAARRIHATFAVPHDHRLAATRFLFAKVITIG